jgi:hypothetical protein
MPGEELPMELRADHVVRRCHDQAQVADNVRIVAEGAEGLDVGHGFLCSAMEGAMKGAMHGQPAQGTWGQCIVR